MGTHNICLYKGVHKKYIGCNLNTTELLDCPLIGVYAEIMSNTASMVLEKLNIHESHHAKRELKANGNNDSSSMGPARASDQFIPMFVCAEVLRPSQPNGVMSSVVSLPNHMFTGQA